MRTTRAVDIEVCFAVPPPSLSSRSSTWTRSAVRWRAVGRLRSIETHRRSGRAVENWLVGPPVCKSVDSVSDLPEQRSLLAASASVYSVSTACSSSSLSSSSTSSSAALVGNPTRPVLAMHVTYDGDMPVLSVEGFSRQRVPQWALLALLLGLLWVLRRIVITRHLRRPYVRADLAGDIAAFYDARSAAWESVWGEHMHHGLYDEVRGRRLRGVAAQERTMSELLEFARLGGASDNGNGNGNGAVDSNGTGSGGMRVLDVGCGIGGASRFLAHALGPDATIHGVTLSPVQAARAAALNAAAGVADRVHVAVRDAQASGFAGGSFDLVWSLESAEHMPEKARFVAECARVARPGGAVVLLAWCVRESSPPLSMPERFHLRKIMEQYCLPRLAPPSEYATELLRAGLVDARIDDWTARAAPFWPEVARSAFTPAGLAALARYGWPLARSALAMRHVVAAINLGAFRLVAITARKPLVSEPIPKVALRCKGDTARSSAS